MVNKLLVVTGLIAFVLVALAGAQVALTQTAACFIEEFDCSVEREGDVVTVSLDTDVSDVRLTSLGDCVGETFSEDGLVELELVCPAGMPRVHLDVSVLYTDANGARAVASGIVVA